MNHSYCCYRLSGPFQNCSIFLLHRYFVVQDNHGVLTYLPPTERHCSFSFLSIMTLSNIYICYHLAVYFREYDGRQCQCSLNHHYLSSGVSSSFLLLSCSLHFRYQNLSQSQVQHSSFYLLFSPTTSSIQFDY